MLNRSYSDLLDENDNLKYKISEKDYALEQVIYYFAKYQDNEIDKELKVIIDRCERDILL